MGHIVGSPKTEVHRNLGLPKEDRKISNKQSNHNERTKTMSLLWNKT